MGSSNDTRCLTNIVRMDGSKKPNSKQVRRNVSQLELSAPEQGREIVRGRLMRTPEYTVGGTIRMRTEIALFLS